MRLWNGWGNEDSDLTMELSDGLRSLAWRPSLDQAPRLVRQP